jgi:hypothetical protein
MSKDNDTSRNRAIKAGRPMEPKTEKTKAVEAGKATNPTGERAKAHGADNQVRAKNEPG